MKTTISLFALLLVAFVAVAQDNKAVSYKELQKHLPGKIAGFTASGDPDGQSMSMNGMSYAMASQDYEKDKEQMTVTIMDYKGAGSLYSAAAMAWTMNMEYEDDEKKVSSFKDGDFHGMIEVGKEYKEVTITSGYKERYFVQIQIQGSDDESSARKVLKELRLTNLP
ncbi:MAG: hypothetical protein AAF519_00505 [Bacteroidota bacterium]